MKKHTEEVIVNCRHFTEANDKANNQRFLEAIDVVKAEAIKEFAERLKEKAYRPNPYPYIEILTKEDIDSLVKEMTEGGAE